MEKRIFNKIIKQLLLSYGFEKTGIYDYAKESVDGVTKVVIRAPDQTYGFGIGLQFKDFLTDYADYSGKFSKICMSYNQPSMLLPFASKFDYSKEDVENAINILIKRIEPFLKIGKSVIRDTINEWTFGLLSEKRQNDIFSYFKMPLINPYSDEYISKQVEDWYKQSGKTMISIDEYENHKEHYDKYTKYGCQISIGKEFVTIEYEQ